MSSEAPPRRPAPLAPEALAGVPGVLGEIARERADDLHAGPGLRAALVGRAAAGHPPAVIAEVKRASPSLGSIADLDPAATARAYEAAGAAAVSVLTEPRRFDGALAHLRATAAAVAVPVLRKDFVVHPRQLEEAAFAGAAGALLIVGLLGEATAAYLAYAQALGLDALVEVHDDAELEVAVAAGARLVGVNNRDLRTLAIDLEVAPRLLRRGRALAPETTWVAESGYAAAAAVVPLIGLADAVLIGGSLAGAGDPGAALRRLLADLARAARTAG